MWSKNAVHDFVKQCMPFSWKILKRLFFSKTFFAKMYEVS